MVLSCWAHKPKNLSFEVAGGLPVIADTATRALDEVGVKSGETLLVSGAAGGIGSAVLQFARLRGINVIGTASVQKHDYRDVLGSLRYVRERKDTEGMRIGLFSRSWAATPRSAR